MNRRIKVAAKAALVCYCLVALYGHFAVAWSQLTGLERFTSLAPFFAVILLCFWAVGR